MNTRKHTAETQYIYIKQENNQCLRMESKIETMYLHVLGVSVLRLPLGMF